MNYNIPRRCSIDKACPAEIAIRAALAVVENMPADERLTWAGNYLLKALDLVADYVDGVPLKKENLNLPVKHMYKPITYFLLVEKKWNKSDIDLFEAHFGKTKVIPLTIEILDTFFKIFDIEWVARELLTNEDLLKFKEVIKLDYERRYNAIKAASANYYIAVSNVDREYYSDIITSDKASNDKDEAYAEYIKVIAPFYAEYEKAKALAFIEIYKS